MMGFSFQFPGTLGPVRVAVNKQLQHGLWATIEREPKVTEVAPCKLG